MNTTFTFWEGCPNLAIPTARVDLVQNPWCDVESTYAMLKNKENHYEV